MTFSEEFLRNPIFRDQPLVFDPLLGEQIDGERKKTGAVYQENGDVRITLYAPGIRQVKAVINREEYFFPETKTAGSDCALLSIQLAMDR